MSGVSAVGEGTAVRLGWDLMGPEQIQLVVRSRYGAFAETGGHKEPC
ncbi:MAG: hypothetical protein ACRDJF_08245 [Actinomycetota bacterium]